MDEKHIAYYYNGIIKPEETDIDLEGLMRIPSEGEVLIRPGRKQWKVVQIVVRYRKANTVSIYLVYLTEA